MYLNKKQEHALHLALEAMESYSFNDDECNEAIDIIVDMLHNSEKERYKRKQAKNIYNFLT